MIDHSTSPRQESIPVWDLGYVTCGEDKSCWEIQRPTNSMHDLVHREGQKVVSICDLKESAI